jgi:hypothetical protein
MLTVAVIDLIKRKAIWMVGNDIADLAAAEKESN